MATRKWEWAKDNPISRYLWRKRPLLVTDGLLMRRGKAVLGASLMFKIVLSPGIPHFLKKRRS
jgi:hypothetical protein